MTHHEIATRLQNAKDSRTPIAQFSKSSDAFSVEDAYAIQSALLEMAKANGEKLCGYKMGLTSHAKQRDVGVYETIHGFLLESMELSPGGTLMREKTIHPRVEPEIAVVLKEGVSGKHVTLREIERKLQGIYPALEIVDSRYENFVFTVEDVVADNTSACGFMVGGTNLISRREDLSLLGVTVRRNGTLAHTGAPAAVFGDPLLSVVALAKRLAKEGKAIEPNHVILTGGITQSVPLEIQDRIEVDWGFETLFLHVT